LSLVVLGGSALWKQDRPFFGATAATVVLCSLFAVGYDTSDSFWYLIPALVCLILWLGMGACWLFEWLEGVLHGFAWVPTVLALLLLLLPSILAVSRFSTQNLREDRAAYSFGSAILNQAPEHAILLTQEDAHTFALWYFRHALGRRPDVMVVDLGLLAQDWYAAQLAKALGAPVAPMLAREAGRRQVVEDLQRPVCMLASQAPNLACLEPIPTGEQ
jgi:hypothetical protein